MLERAGIATTGQRGIHILGALAMQGVLCLGAMRARQPTFVLLDEWVEGSRSLEHDEALGELTRRYFTSHGPATVGDFSWWSGLPLGDVRRGLDVAGTSLTKVTMAEEEYWGPPPPSAIRRETVAHLLPPWDEFTVGYRGRDAFLDPAHAKRAGNGIFSPVVTIDGRIAGVWRRKAKKGRMLLHVELFGDPKAAAQTALEQAAARYLAFLGVEGSLETATG